MFRSLTSIIGLNHTITCASSLVASRPYRLTSCSNILSPCFSRFINTNQSSSKHKLDFRINSHQNQDFLQYTDDKTNVELDDLELTIGSDKLCLNLTWLRDSCHCNKCTHQYSRQRLFTFKNFRKDLFTINDVNLVSQLEPHEQVHLGPIKENCNEGYLSVRWSDGHRSFYSLNWLNRLQSIYNKSYLKPYLPDRTVEYPRDDLYCPLEGVGEEPQLWDVAKIKSKLRPIDYLDLVDDFQFNQDATFINANKLEDMTTKRFKAIHSLSDQLVLNGLAFIVNVPTEPNQVLNVTRSLAYERPTGYGAVFNVTVEPNEDINLAYSSLEFDLHSDLTYRETSPGVQLLHCIRNSIDGGLSYFADSFYAANVLRETTPQLYKVLLKFPVTFAVRDPYRNVIFRSQQPIIGQDVQGYLKEVYYSPFSLPPLGFIDDIKLFYLAIDKFTRILQSSENKLVSKMNPGDMFIFHNRRVLHGRSSYDATTSRRFLQGCYMDWDEIKCLREKMHTHEIVSN